jgi:hypothetical protein
MNPSIGKNWLYLLILFLLIILISIPFELTISPERKFQILDRYGNLIKNGSVRQNWDQYALNVHGGIDVKPGNNGEVYLPRRSVRTSAVVLFWGAIKEFKSYGIHASFGSSEGIGIFVPGFVDTWIYNGKGIERGIVIIGKKP